MRLYLLGPTRCVGPDGHPLEAVARSPKRLALLSYLTLAQPRGFHRRDLLLGLLWPDFEQDRARANLRQTTKQLRDDLGDVVESRGRDALGVRREALWCDAVEFERLAQGGDGEDALGLYGQDLLAGFYSGSDGFDRWLDRERERLKRIASRTAWLLAESASENRHAARWARRAYALSGEDEGAARRWMTLLDARGDPVAALRAYDAFRTRTETDLGMPPGPATRGLADSIRERAGRAAERTRPEPEGGEARPGAPTYRTAPITAGPAGRSARMPVAMGVTLALVLVLGMSSWLDRNAAGPMLGSVSAATREPGLELFPDLSPDGDRLAYAAGVPGDFDISVRRLSGGGAVSITEGLGGSHVWPDWSPDGEQIAFVTLTPGGDFRLQVVGALGGARRTLIESGGARWIHAPSWSPDGSALAFTLGHEIHRVDVASGETSRVAAAWEPHSLAWDPTGEVIAFVSESFQYAGAVEIGNRAPTSIWLVASGGGEPVPIVDAGDAFNHSPSWLSERRLLFVSNREGAPDLYELRLDGDLIPRGPPARITTDLGLLTVSVSADGSRLAYDVPQLAANVWKIPIPDEPPVPVSESERITSANQFIETFSASPDGRWIAFDSNRNGNADLFKITTEGEELMQLTSDPADDFAPAWSPDGRLLAFYSFREGSRDLFLVETNGARARRLTAQPGSEAFPTWSPAGDALAFQWAGRGGPDGTVSAHLAFVRRNGSGEGWSDPTPSDLEVQVPRWSPDGRFVAGLVSGAVVIFEVATGAWRVLRDSIDFRGPPVWSGDGDTVYVVATIDDRGGIWGLPLSGDRPELLVTIPGRFLRRTWFDSDGRFFYLTRNESREADISVVELRRP